MGKIEKSFYWFSFVLVIYICIGFKLVPYILKDQIETNLNNHLTLKSTVEKVEFNPFTLNTKIHNLKLGDDKTPTISLKQFQLDIGLLQSIFELHGNLESITLKEAVINVVENKDGTFNLSKILKPTNKKEENDKDKSKSDIKFLVSKIALENSTINFIKIKEDKPYKLSLNNINYTLYNIGTFNNALGSNDFKLKLNNDTKLSVQGGFKLSPFTMYGTASISNLKLNELLSYKKEMMNFDLDKKARFDLKLDYNIDTKDDLELIVNTKLLELNNLNITQNKQSLIKLPKFSINKLHLDLAKQNIVVNSPTIHSSSLNIVKNKNALNLSTLIKSENSKASKSEDVKSSNKKESSKPWTIAINKLGLNNTRLNYKDNTTNTNITNENFTLNVNNINLNGSDIDIKTLKINNPKLSFTDNKNKLFIKLSNENLIDSIKIKDNNININSIKLSKNKLELKDKKSSFNINTNNTSIDLKSLAIQNNIIDIDKIDLLSKSLKVNNHKTKLYINTKNTSVNLQKLKIKDNTTTINKISVKNPYLNFQDKKGNININSKNLKVTLNKLLQNKYGLKLSSLSLYEPSLNFYNTKDKTKIFAKNVNLYVSRISNNKKGLKIGKASINKPILSVVLPKKNNRENNDKKKEEKKKKVSSKQSNSKLDIGPINIKNAVLNFEDKNLPVPFKTTISKLNGQISEFNTINSDTTSLSVKGTVDKYGTTKISGVINPNSIKVLTDINMLFKNISMKNFTPYTGKFIGKELESGKLDLDLKYNIEKSDLDATNNIVITKIKFGKDIQSKDAVSLPLDLAIALLEDSNGIIDLNIPVSGNVDDPQFSIAPIVWKAFTNLIVKAITAPFSLLGAIFGFDENEIKSVKFDFGQSSIEPMQQETLDKIAQILTKRQNIVLNLVPSYDENKDTNALKKVKFTTIIDKELPNKNIRSYDKKYLSLVEDTYEKHYKDIKSIKKSFIENEKLNKKKYLSKLEEMIISKQKVTKLELETMAKLRVVNIKKYLVKEKIIKTKQVSIKKDIQVNTFSDKTSDINLEISK